MLPCLPWRFSTIELIGYDACYDYDQFNEILLISHIYCMCIVMFLQISFNFNFINHGSDLKGQSNRRLISMKEVKQHQSEGSSWTVLKGRVYNLSPYMRFHPGGMDNIYFNQISIFSEDISMYSVYILLMELKASLSFSVISNY